MIKTTSVGSPASFQWILVHSYGAVWSINEWSKRHWVDHANGEIHAVVNNKTKGKVAVIRDLV